MATPSQREERDLLRLRRAVGKADQALADLDRQILAPEGLCASDLSILERLARRGASAVNDLGRRIGLTSGSITTAVQRLKSRHLVLTERSVGDKRVVSVSVTPAGEALARRLTATRAEAFQAVFCELGSRERDLLQTLLKRVRKSAKDRVHPTESDSEAD